MEKKDFTTWLEKIIGIELSVGDVYSRYRAALPSASGRSR